MYVSVPVSQRHAHPHRDSPCRWGLFVWLGVCTSEQHLEVYPIHSYICCWSAFDFPYFWFRKNAFDSLIETTSSGIWHRPSGIWISALLSNWEYNYTNYDAVDMLIEKLASVLCLHSATAAAVAAFDSAYEQLLSTGLCVVGQVQKSWQTPLVTCVCFRSASQLRHTHNTLCFEPHSDTHT